MISPVGWILSTHKEKFSFLSHIRRRDIFAKSWLCQTCSDWTAHSSQEGGFLSFHSPSLYIYISSDFPAGSIHSKNISNCNTTVSVTRILCLRKVRRPSASSWIELLTCSVIRINTVPSVCMSSCRVYLVLRFTFRVKLWNSGFRHSIQNFKLTPWFQSASELYRPSDRRLSAKLVPTLVERWCRMVSATNPHGR
jgi:hypothetical protein